MKITVEKNELLVGLDHCVAVTEAKSPNVILTNVSMVANAFGLVLFATDLMRSMTVNVRADVATEGGICLPVRELYNRIKLLPEGRISITVDSLKATLKTVGTARRYTLNGIPTAEFPTIPAPSQPDSELETTTHKLAELIGGVCHAISTDPSRPHISSLLFESADDGLRLVATDGHRLATVTNGREPKGASWLIPLASVGELRKLFATKDDQPVTLKRSGSSLFVKLGSFEFSTLLTDRQYVPWKQIVPTVHERHVTLDRGALVEALKAMRVASSDRTGCVAFTFKKDVLVLEAESVEMGEGFDEIASDYSGSDASVAFNCAYLLDALQALAAPQVTMSTSGELDPAVIRAAGSDEYLALVMPIRK